MMYPRLIISLCFFIGLAPNFAQAEAKTALPADDKKKTTTQQASRAHTCQVKNNIYDDGLTKFRNGTHRFVCRTVKGIDGWFGNKQQFDDSNFGGKLILGFRQDEDTGFDPRIRLRLNAKLPNVSKRFNAFIGRTDNDAFIQDRKITGIDDINNDLVNEDTRWLIGLGYRNNKKIGFDTSFGASFSSGIQPFAKLRYRYFKQFNYFATRFKQTVFWENEDGFGTTSSLSIDKPINDKYLVTLDLESTILKDTEIFENGASFNVFRKLSNRSGISFNTYIEHESGSNSTVTVPEYGVSVTYRRPILKPWIVLRTSLENRWERQDNDDPIDSFLKLGVQFEMTFGKFKRKR